MEKSNLPEAVVIDLDGTLLRSDGSISDYTLSVLERCREKGICIIVATARFWFKAEKYLEIIRPDYAVLADGTQIYLQGSLIHGFPMERNQSRAFISDLSVESSGKPFVVSTGKHLLCSGSGINEVWRRSFDFSTGVSEPVYKIAAVLDSPEKAEALAVKHSCRMYSYRGENLYGFTSKAAGKYSSVCALSMLLNIRLRDMTAFGDDLNDSEILRCCGTGVAMANAIPSIKEVADMVTDSNDEDGVARYLERVCMS